MEGLRRPGFPLGLLRVGFLARRAGLLTERRTEWLTGVAFSVGAPGAGLRRGLRPLAGGAVPASQAAVATAVVLFGMPGAVSTYVCANELGGDARFASVTVFATTVASLLLVAVGVQVLA